jgi:hypothetical protein
MKRLLPNYSSNNKHNNSHDHNNSKKIDLEISSNSNKMDLVMNNEKI